MTYIVYWLSTLSLFFLSNRSPGKKIGVYLILITVPIFTATFFSFNTLSPDKFIYGEMFGDVSVLPNLGSVIKSDIHGDTGYKVLTWFFSFISESFYYFSFVFFVFVVYLKLSFYSKYDVDFPSVMLFYLSHAMLYQESIQIRTGLAAALCLIGLYYLFSKGKPCKAVLWFVFSSFFHLSSFIFLLGAMFVYFIVNKIDLVRYVMFGFIFSLSFRFMGGFDILIETLNVIGILPEGVNNYVNWKKFQVELSLMNPNTVKQVILIALLVYINAKLRLEDVKKLVMLYSLSPFLLISLGDLAILSTRLATYFAVVEPILITLVIYKFFKPTYAIPIVILLASFFYFYNIYYVGLFDMGYEHYAL